MVEIESQFMRSVYEVEKIFRRAIISATRKIIFGRVTGVTALDIEIDIIIVADRPNLSHYLFKRNERQHLKVHRPTIRRNPISSSWFPRNR